MPLTTFGSYVPTIEEFRAHWLLVNVELGGTPATDMKLPGGYTVANLATDRDALQAAISDIQTTDNARQNAADARDLAKAALLPRLSQFKSAVRTSLFGTQYPGMVPRLPAFSAVESKFLQPFDDMAKGWATINSLSGIPGFTPPLLLGTYTLANFTADLAALRALYRTLNDANVNARNSRRKRDVLLPPLKTRLRQYRDAVIAALGPAHSLVGTIPALSPAPGSTPDAVSVTGTWDPDQEKGVLTWLPSANPNLSHYSVRTSPAPYRTDEETSVGLAAPDATTFATTTGLPTIGSEALFKVYVVLSTGNEKGSATVKIKRTT